jgi:hypothetical protein
MPCRDQLNVLLSKYENMFEDSYKGMKGFEAHITMKDGATYKVMWRL